MRTASMWLLATSVLGGAIVAAAPAGAQEYPWCAVYGNTHGGRNCGFASYGQCMAALSGNGGYCERNLFFRPEPRPAARPRTIRR